MINYEKLGYVRGSENNNLTENCIILVDLFKTFKIHWKPL